MVNIYSIKKFLTSIKMSNDCVTYLNRHKRKKSGISTNGFIILLLLILLAAMLVYYSKEYYFDNGEYRKMKCFSYFID